MNESAEDRWLKSSLLFTPFVAVALLIAAVSVQTQGKTAADIYRDKCVVCHGEDGAGKTAKGKKVKVKDVRETVKSMTVEQMVDIVTKGKDPDMDAFGKEFTPAQIHDLVANYRGLATKK
jgi:mono/diheme cytochrome c family protein